jgi:hypothetical protein
MNRETEYDGIGIQDADSASQIIQIDSGKHVAVIAICAAVAGAAAVFAWHSAIQSDYAVKRADMLQYYTMELDGKLMASGVIKYEESWAARNGFKPLPPKPAELKESP